MRSVQAVEYENKFFVNPGTATGAWTGAFNGYVVEFITMSHLIGPPLALIPVSVPLLFASCSVLPWLTPPPSDPTPSFALMDIQGPVVVTYVYQLIEGEVRVEKIEFRKETEPAVPREAPAVPRVNALPQAIPNAPPAAQSVW